MPFLIWHTVLRIPFVKVTSHTWWEGNTIIFFNQFSKVGPWSCEPKPLPSPWEWDREQLPARQRLGSMSHHCREELWEVKWWLIPYERGFMCKICEAKSTEANLRCGLHFWPLVFRRGLQKLAQIHRRCRPVHVNSEVTKGPPWKEMSRGWMGTVPVTGTNRNKGCCFTLGSGRQEAVAWRLKEEQDSG